VRRFAVLDRPLSIDDGELTPTLKLRRGFIEKKYADTIADLYDAASQRAKCAADVRPPSKEVS
jgi:long-chain acyl-CoA synthetase